MKDNSRTVLIVMTCLLCSVFILSACITDSSDGHSINTNPISKGELTMSNEELKFYPEHPSGTKTHQIETTDMPLLEQDAAFEVKTLHDEFWADQDAFLAAYQDKRFEVTGVAVKVGPDVHNKPSIEIAEEIGGRTYALVIFPTDDHYNKVEVGDQVTVRANYLVMSNWFGTVMKHSELIAVEK